MMKDSNKQATERKIAVASIKAEGSMKKSAAGGLHQYANTSMIALENDVWKKTAVKKHISK